VLFNERGLRRSFPPPGPPLGGASAAAPLLNIPPLDSLRVSDSEPRCENHYIIIEGQQGARPRAGELFLTAVELTKCTRDRVEPTTARSPRRSLARSPLARRALAARSLAARSPLHMQSACVHDTVDARSTSRSVLPSSTKPSELTKQNFSPRCTHRAMVSPMHSCVWLSPGSSGSSREPSMPGLGRCTRRASGEGRQ
jgi:hypothetical protein